MKIATMITHGELPGAHFASAAAVTEHSHAATRYENVVRLSTRWMKLLCVMGFGRSVSMRKRFNGIWTIRAGGCDRDTCERKRSLAI
jgi:hypothetical protein